MFLETRAGHSIDRGRQRGQTALKKKKNKKSTTSWSTMLEEQLLNAVGGFSPGRWMGLGQGSAVGDIPSGDQASADEAPPPSAGTDTAPDPSPALLAELLMSPASPTTTCGLYPPPLLVLGSGREASGHKGQRCFISISPWCLATLLSALSFASGKCLSPYHRPDRNLTSPSGEEWKNLSDGKSEELFGLSPRGAEFKEGGVTHLEGDKGRSKAENSPLPCHCSH